MQNKVLVTGTGAVASAIVRALVPAGYSVATIGLESKGIAAYKNLANEWIASPERVMKVLQAEKNKRINPVKVLEAETIPHVVCDLSNKRNISKDVFKGVDTVIMAAANPNSDQNSKSASKNYQIDKNTIDAAVKAGVKNIVYTSSVWRTVRASYPAERSELLTPEMEAPDLKVPYALFKAKSVKYLRKIAASNKNIRFSHIDLGWYPRETMGAPISNVKDLYLQWWIAECELQQHYLQLVNIESVKFFKKLIDEGENYFCFNGFSENYPPRNIGHCPFAYDLTNSVKLEVRHEFNVYEVIRSRTSDWRRIPVPSK